MKVRHQGAILLGVPIVCQLISAAVLITSVVSMERATARETAAKQVLAICQDLRTSLAWDLFRVCNRKLFGDDQIKAARKSLHYAQEYKVEELRMLVQGDKEAENFVENYKQKIIKFTDTVLDAEYDRRSGKLSFSRFLRGTDYERDLLFLFHSVITADKALNERFAPIAKELQPKARANRTHVLRVVTVTVLLNTVTVVILALIVGKKLLGRMSILHSNIRKFSSGRNALDPLKGNDELSDLDVAFREMAEARWNAEDRRQEMVSMVAHDLRSPLTSSGITLQLLLESEGKEMKPTTFRRLRKLHSEMKRVIHLADGLLDVERIELGQFELTRDLISIQSLFDSSVTAVGGLAEAREVSIEEHCEEGTTVYCDSQRVVQVLINLLSNAIKFTPQNSVVSVRAVRDQTRTRFEVIDHGTGIPEEDRARLFKKFSQLDQDSETRKRGTGLGLYLSKLLVEAHQGKIGCDNQPEGGACFWFEIPATAKEAAPESENSLAATD